MNDITALMATMKAAAADKVRYSVLTHNDCRALVEALEKAQTERDEFRNRLKLERSILEDADKRIAELESKLAKPVLLPKTNGYWTEQEKAYEEAITLAKRQVRLAGFCVEDM